MFKLLSEDTVYGWATLVVVLLAVAGFAYGPLIKEPRQNAELVKRGVLVRAVWTRDHYYRVRGTDYTFTYYYNKIDVWVDGHSLPDNYSYPDTLDVFYLPEDPYINRAAFVLFPEYKYGGQEERSHLPRPVFDSTARRYVKN